MSLAKLLNNATQVSELKKIYFTLAIIVSLLLTLTFYLNYEALKNQKIKISLKYRESLNSAIELSFDSYTEMFETISTRITNSDLESKKISALLKQFYPSNENSSKIPFLDLTWHDEKSNISLNRYGQVEGALQLSKELKSALNHGTRRIFLTTIHDQLSLSGHKQLYIVMNIANSPPGDSSYLTALLNFDNWIAAQSESLKRDGIMIALTDNQNQILISSNYAVEKTQDTHSSQLDYYQFIKKIDLLPHSSYYLLIGYNKKQLWEELKARIAPQLVISVVICMVSSLLFFLFKKKLKNEQKQHFALEIEELKDANQQYLKEVDLIKSKLVQSESFLEVYKLSFNERDRLLCRINSVNAHVTKDIQDAATDLHSSKTSNSATRLTTSEEISILSQITNKSDFLAVLCVPCDNEETDIEEVAKIVANLYAKDIFKKSLSFCHEIKANVKTISFNSLLFTQILASLIYLAIDAAKPGGHIFLEASRKKSKNGDKLIILIKDDGYYFDDSNLFKKSDSSLDTCPLRLSINTIKSVLEKYNCYISTNLNQDGKTLELHFLCSNGTPQGINSRNYKGSNVIPLKKIQ